MQQRSSNDKYIIRSDATGFLHLSRVDPAQYQHVRRLSNEKSLDNLSINWCNENNMDLLSTPPDQSEECSAIPNYLSISNDNNYFKEWKDLLKKCSSFDVVIIPSGGMDDNGVPYLPVLARLDAAAQLNPYTRFYISSGAYTPLKPVLLNSTGQPLTEARSDALYLVEQHQIDQRKLILEEMSKDTLGNAYFSRILCTLMHFQDIVVVTSKFHMLRTRALFDWVFSLNPAVDTTIQYIETTDDGMSAKDVSAREEKEVKSLQYFWSNTKQNLASMKDLTQFIYLGHRAYAFNDKVGCYNVTAPSEAFKFY